MKRPPLARTLLVAISLASLSFGTSSHAQDNPKSARILIKPDRVVETTVIIARDNLLIVTAPKGNGTVGLPIDQIISCDFNLPEPVVQANALYAKGDFAEAIKLYSRHLNILLSLSAFPMNNAADSLLNFIDSHRQLGDFKAVSDNLARLPADLPDSAQQRADLLAAIVLVDKRELRRAREQLDKIPEIPPSSPNFSLDCIARAVLAFAGEQPEQGRRSLGRCIALVPINDRHYPEALALAFQSEGNTSDYERLLRETASRESGLDVDIDSSNLLALLEYCFAGHYWTTHCQKMNKPTE